MFVNVWDCVCLCVCPLWTPEAVAAAEARAAELAAVQARDLAERRRLHEQLQQVRARTRPTEALYPALRRCLWCGCKR